MAFYARCITTPFPSLLNTSPRSTLRLFRNKSQSSSFLSLSLHRYEQTDLCFWQFASRGRMRKLASGTLRRSLDAPRLENGNNGSEGKEGAPLLTRFTERGRKRGTAARSGAIVSRGSPTIVFVSFANFSYHLWQRGGSIGWIFRIFREIIFQLHDTSKYSLEGLNNAFTWLERGRDRLYISSKQLFSSVRNDLENETFSEKRSIR